LLMSRVKRPSEVKLMVLSQYSTVPHSPDI
jgi:hypothetical protein